MVVAVGASVVVVGPGAGLVSSAARARGDRRHSDDAWQPIPYWLSKTPEVSGADIAEVPFNVFASDKRHARQVRLVVRRARPTPSSQLALLTAWDYNAFVTDRTLPLAEAEADQTGGMRSSSRRSPSSRAPGWCNRQCRPNLQQTPSVVVIAPAPVRAPEHPPGAIATGPMRLGEKVVDYRARPGGGPADL